MHYTLEELKKSNGAQGEKSLKLEADPVLRVAEAI
jgi:predicted heme/steroid binding protein